MRVVTLNANGIRAAARRGFYAWMEAAGADVVCLQETRAREHQLPEEAASASHRTAAFLEAEKPGYSGVAMYARKAADRIVRGLGLPQFDREARYLQFDYGQLSVASLYMPSGTSGEVRQGFKETFMETFYERLARMRADGRSYVICGDFNIAHADIDVHDPLACSRSSGFFPHERAWMSRVLDDLGWVDAFRVVDPAPARYTWWSNRRQAFERNQGWRIDYQLITPDLRARVRRASIYTAERFSDHAPVVVDYDEI